MNVETGNIETGNFEDVVKQIQPVDEAVAEEARARQDQLTKPPGSLGRLEDLGIRLAAIQGTVKPKVTGGVVVFAADHGVTEAGVSAFPKAVTEQMVLNFLNGGAAVNALAGVAGAELLTVDVGVDADFAEHPKLLQRKVVRGTQNFLEQPAMTSEQVGQALSVGVEAANRMIDGGANVLVGGDMGIGNTTPAAALTAVLTGKSVQDVTGRGTGVDDEGLKRKIEVIEQALEKHQPDAGEPLDVLAKVGGLEIAALTGFYLGAAARGTAVVLDGFIVTSAALVAAAVKPEAKDYFFASHTSQEPGHRVQLETLGLTPLFDLGLRLGEGTGGVLALPLLASAAAVLSEMATFAEAGVSGAS